MVDATTVSAITKWPNVPYCFGWLSLDRRGEFRIRNEFAQKNHLPGDVIKHPALCEIIKKNYCIDDRFQYFFQNGPQRVYIDLAYCPYVVRFIPGATVDWVLKTHLGQEVTPTRCFLDEKGHVLLAGEVMITQASPLPEVQFTPIQLPTIALLHDHDLELFASLSQMNVANCGVIGVFHWRNIDIAIEPVLSKDVPKMFGFQPHPTSN